MAATNLTLMSADNMIDGTQSILDSTASPICIQRSCSDQKESEKSDAKSNPKSDVNINRRRKKRKRNVIDTSTINLHLSVLSSYPPSMNINPTPNESNSKSSLIDPDKKTGLNLQWQSHFCLTEESESILQQWVMDRFPYSVYGFSNGVGEDVRSYILKQQDHCTDTILQNLKCHLTGKSILELDVDLITKTMSKFHFLPFSRWQLLCNKSMNMFFKNENARKWWNSQVADLRNIDATEWNRKCMEWKIMPSKLLKELLAQKKV